MTNDVCGGMKCGRGVGSEGHARLMAMWHLACWLFGLRTGGQAGLLQQKHCRRVYYVWPRKPQRGWHWHQGIAAAVQKNDVAGQCHQLGRQNRQQGQCGCLLTAVCGCVIVWREAMCSCCNRHRQPAHCSETSPMVCVSVPCRLATSC